MPLILQSIDFKFLPQLAKPQKNIYGFIAQFIFVKLDIMIYFFL